MRIPVMVLITLLPLGGCDIFLEDEGGEGMPCWGPDDCQKGLTCEEDHLCHKPPDQTPFGEKCQLEVQGSCKGEFAECVCFGGPDCFCTRRCSNAHECDNIPGNGSVIRCTLIDTLGLEGFCADWQWTSSYGNLCVPGDMECDNGLCATFPVNGLHVCTTGCGACPEAYSCEPAVEPSQGVCGLAHWFGFWHGCMNDSECNNQYPSFSICKNDQNCTKPCTGDAECPFMSHCDNTPSGHCVPDM
jgi:hypothetical protein